ncbi:MAG: 1,4-alpha-glucan branching protein GlgB [Ignavibacteriae bacterium]|nr:1,4-alpha-glucan branching protein GlgB [Ignavibacteriota bacterium]
MTKNEFAKYGISDFDLYLLSEGNHYRIYEKLGAKVKTIDGVKGVRFAVWAPNAKNVNVVGNFNYWNAESHPMENVMSSGVWALFVPGLKEGETYKYAIKSKHNNDVHLKADPFAFQSEIRPRTASVVNSLENYQWKDKEWLAKREQLNFQKSPFSIYEVHLGSWKRDYKNENFPNDAGYKSYKQIAYELVDYVKQMGYTHIELLPIMEHPLDESWGYQVVSYFAPSSRYGTPQDFMFFVDYCHQNEIGVLLDWVPAHFPTDEHGLSNFDGTQLFAYKSLKKGYHKEWGTLVFDYGRNEVRNFLISNALFWFEKYHLDGLRVDAVASMLYLDYSRKDGEWEPNVFGGRENLEAIDFIKKLNEVVHLYHKGIVTIAEESTAFPMVSRPTYIGGLGFDMKWNMGWMNDSLRYFSKEPIHRKFHQNMITFSLWYAFNENFVLPISHDEVVHGKKSLLEKMPGDDWQRFANLRLFFFYMFGHPGKKLNFMSNDFAQYKEWNVNDSLDWFVLDFELHKKLNYFVKDINNLYKNHPAMFEMDFKSEGFEWVDFSDADNSVIAFMRKSENNNEILLFVLNMTPVLRENYILGVPFDGFYKEILNSDGFEYGGSGKGNAGGVSSDQKTKNQWYHTICITLPPLGGLIFKIERNN